jgi:putrescine aminotransferase
MTTAKALTSGYQPLSALLVGERITDTLMREGGEFYHGYTYAGHPVACAVALANLDIIEREGLIERVREDTGPYLLQALREHVADHSLVGEVRGFGLLAAIEIVQGKESRARLEPLGHAAAAVRDHATANGLIMRATGDTNILSPPLTWTRAEIDMAVEIIGRALGAAQAQLQREGKLA